MPKKKPERMNEELSESYKTVRHQIQRLWDHWWNLEKVRRREGDLPDDTDPCALFAIVFTEGELDAFRNECLRRARACGVRNHEITEFYLEPLNRGPGRKPKRYPAIVYYAGVSEKYGIGGRHSSRRYRFVQTQCLCLDHHFFIPQDEPRDQILPGVRVTYKAGWDLEEETGTVKSMSPDPSMVFVRYDGEAQAKATRIEDLTLVEQPHRPPPKGDE
jgi:hypothetical protein